MIQDQSTKAIPRKSVLIEAETIINGDRRADYGPVYPDFSRTIDLINVLLGDKIEERIQDGGKPLHPEDWPLMIICAKLSREMHRVKRDNLVDIAGYIGCLEKLYEEMKS